MLGPKLRTPEARKRRRILRLIQGSVGLLILAIFVGILSWIAHLDVFRLKSVEVHGASSISVEALQEKTLELLQGKRFFVFPRSNSILYPRASMEKTLRYTFPRIKEANFTRQGMNALQLVIDEREPFALWCGDVVPDLSEPTSLATSTEAAQETDRYGACYIMDNTSFIFDRVGLLGESNYHRFYGAIERGEVVGQALVEAAEFERFHSFMDGLLEAEIIPIALLLIDEEELEVYLTDGPRVLVSRNDEFPSVIKTLEAALDSSALDRDDLSNIEYIDIRFGNKVYFKEKGEAIY